MNARIAGHVLSFLIRIPAEHLTCGTIAHREPHGMRLKGLFPAQASYDMFHIAENLTIRHGARQRLAQKEGPQPARLRPFGSFGEGVRLFSLLLDFQSSFGCLRVFAFR